MQKIFFPSGNQTLAGNLFLPENIKNPLGLLILHGAGHSSKERFMDIQIALEKIQIASLAIDFRGVGESTGEFVDGSLTSRIEDARAALKELKKYTDENHVAIFGSSMGGFIAPIVGQEFSVQAIVLSAAAAYSPDSEEKPLNKEFTKIITIPNSWESSRSFTALENFQGQVLVMYGENDTVIPDEIKKRYQKRAKAKGKSIIIPHGTHNIIVGDTIEEEKAKQTMIQAVCHFLSTYLS